MAVLKRRCRFVTFRLLENEYEEFLVLCAREGARSLSDLARSALLRLNEHAEANRLHAKLDMLAESVQEVDREVKRLATIMATRVEIPVEPAGEPPLPRSAAASGNDE